MKVVAEVANASKKKRKLNSFHEEGIYTEGVETNTTQSGIEGKVMFTFKGRGKAKFVQASGEGVQATLNQLYKKGEGKRAGVSKISTSDVGEAGLD